MLTQLTTFAQSAVDYSTTYESMPSSSSGDAGTAVAVLLIMVIIGLIFAIPTIVGLWKVFQKANRPGWAAIVPVYNIWVLLEIGGKPGWWAVLALVPPLGIVTFVMEILAIIEITKRFGKDSAYAVLLILLPFVGWPLLGFGKDTYHGTALNTTAPQGMETPPTPPSPTPPTAPPSTPQPPTTPPSSQSTSSNSRPTNLIQ